MGVVTLVLLESGGLIAITLTILATEVRVLLDTELDPVNIPSSDEVRPTNLS